MQKSNVTETSLGAYIFKMSMRVMCNPLKLLIKYAKYLSCPGKLAAALHFPNNGTLLAGKVLIEMFRDRNWVIFI